MQKHNEYSATLRPHVYEDIPKTVLAAIAVSFGTMGGSEIEQALYRVCREWETLHRQGILSQPPSKAAKEAIQKGKEAGFNSFGGA